MTAMETQNSYRKTIPIFKKKISEFFFDAATTLGFGRGEAVIQGQNRPFYTTGYFVTRMVAFKNSQSVAFAKIQEVEENDVLCYVLACFYRVYSWFRKSISPH